MGTEKSLSTEKHAPEGVDQVMPVGHVLNASGHEQELERNFGLLSICATGIMTGNVWMAVGGSIVVALYNGGPPGVIYEFIACACCYFMIAACIAEMASAIPSSAGVYHWASVTGGARFGKVIGFYAGWWNTLGWNFGPASVASIIANQIISMYGLFHEGYEYERWHIFIIYLIITWISCAIVMFANRALPALTNIGLFFILAGVFITIMVCAIMPSQTGQGYASNSFVWKEWQNQAGWTSDGFVFCAGMLNGAYAVGTPDCVSHLAEELPRPHTNIPKAILVQYIIGFSTGLCYLIAIFYSVNDLDTLFSNPWPFPLAELYRQATNSRAGSLGLLLMIFIPSFCGCIGLYITAGRMLWTLGRDGATPFSQWIGRVDGKRKNPFNATITCGLVNTILGCIYLGSETAFSAFIGSFVVLTLSSYLACILPNILSRRRHIVRGPFTMPDPLFYTVASIASGFIIVWVPIFCFPYAVPFDSETMNYTCALVGGATVLLGGWYVWIRNRGYVGPRRLVEMLKNAETTTLGNEGTDENRM